MLRAWAAAALICWQLAGAALAQDFMLPSGPYVHPPSRLVFPQALGSLDRVSGRDYEAEHPGLGVSFKYISRSPMMFADIYVFNAGVPRIAPGIADPLVERMFKGAINDIYTVERSGRYREVSLLGRDEIALDRRPGAPHMLRARLSYLTPDGPVYSQVYGMAANDYFVKVRLTYRQEQSEEAQALLTGFLQGLGNVVGQQ